jgi:hypothetical protein
MIAMKNKNTLYPSFFLFALLSFSSALLAQNTFVDIVSNKGKLERVWQN